MVTEERQAISAFLFMSGNSSGFHGGQCPRCFLSLFSFHFLLITLWVCGFSLAMCSSGCKHGETNPTSGYPWLKKEEPAIVHNVPQTILWGTYVDEGRNAYNERRYEEAEQLFKKAVAEAEKFGPEDYRLGQSLYWLGSVVWDLGRPAEAKTLLERALGIIEQLKGTEAAMPARPIVIADILGRLSEIEAAKGNYNLAKAFASKAANLSRQAGNDKLLVISLKNLIQISVQSGDYNGAVQSYSELIKLEPDDVSYYYDRALLYKRTGDYESAVADLTRTLELQPDHPRLLNEIAWILSACEVNEVRNGQRSVELAH